jgi:hypothetical protein
MGLWWADGSCGIYTCKKKTKVESYTTFYQWYISNCDLDLLNKVRVLITRTYNVKTSLVKQIKPDCKLNYKLKINGGKSIKHIIDKYLNMFYYKNKHEKYKYGNKYIPIEILNSSIEIRESFLIGYYNGDGTGHSLSVIKKSMDVESKISCQSLYYLCRSLGYEVSINIRTDKPSVYKLIITKGYQTKDKNKIKKIINLGKTNNYVYDLQTENHHFQAGIGQMIIHNCDLIMLSLMNKQSDKIILVRDNTQTCPPTFNYVDISKLKSCIYKDISLEIQFNSDINRIIHDYIFICFLVGNDFIGHVHSLTIKDNGINVVIKCYIKTINKYKYIKEGLKGNLRFPLTPSLVRIKDIQIHKGGVKGEPSVPLKN